MAIEFIQFSAATATDGVLVAADIVDTIGTATGVSVQTIKFGYGTDGVYNEVATGQGLPMATGPVYQVQQMSTATVPVSIAGGVEVNQATATALHAVMHPLGLRDTSNWVYNSVTATGVATFATGAGTNNFNDLVAIYLSNSATTQQTARIRSSSTATVFTMTLAPDGGGFIWQPIKPLPQAVANTGWDIQIENAIATPGITVTALFEQTT